MITHTVRVSAVAAAAALTVGVLSTSAAQAGPAKPGTPTPSASATEPAVGTYDVSVSWGAVTGATSYKATITRAGTILASATMTTTTWDKSLAATPGQRLSVSVRAVNGHRRSKAGTTTLTLEDQIAPTGEFHSTFVSDTGAATITQESLTDDSPVSGITRTVDWGDGSSPEVWPTGDTIDHSYPLVQNRYVPQVTLTDVAGHTTVVDSSGVVVEDDQAPTGTFTVAPAAAWAAFTAVTVTQQGDLTDNWSPADQISRSVDWGDGTSTDWTSAQPLTHVYAAAGSYSPTVTITDEAGNAAVVPTSEVAVTADLVRPTVKLTLPRARHSVRAWKTLRGKATDAQSGVAKVALKAVERRRGAWFGYNARTKKWVRTTTKAKAFAKAKPFVLATNARHRWTASLVGLRKGRLVYRVRATDHVGNVSTTRTHQAALTRR